MTIAHSIANKKSLSSSLVLKKMLCTFGRYYNGNLFKFILDNDQQLQLVKLDNEQLFGASIENSKEFTLLVVSRKFYTEQAKSYPIEKRSELTKLLKLEYNEQSSTKYVIWQQQEGQSKVNIWQFSSKVPSAKILLPESLLIALTNKETQVAEVETYDNAQNSTLFVGQQHKLIHSVLTNDIINTTDRFIMSSGVISNQAEQYISSSILAEKFAQGFNKKLWPIISHFIKKPSSKNLLQSLMNILIPFTLVFSLYLIFSSLFLVSKQYYLKKELLGQSKQVSTLLDQQINFDKNIESYNALQEFLIDKKNSIPLWLILNELFEHAKFTNIRIANGRYVLRGTAEKATDLLARMSKLQGIVDAKFDFPTRKIRDRESFVIGFTIEEFSLPLYKRSLNNIRTELNDIAVIKGSN